MQTESTRPAPNRSARAPRAEEFDGRWALRALQTGAMLVVLAALPYPFFQLDRYTFVKESVLLAAALTAVLLCIGSARKLTVFMVDALVAGFLALSRWQEREADRFGLEMTRDNQAAARAFVRLHDENLAVPRTGLLYRLWRGSHPDLADRIEFSNRYRPWSRGDSLRYGNRFRPLESR